MAKVKTATPAPATPAPAIVIDQAIQGKFLKTFEEMDSALVERTEQTRMVLTALVANQHPLLVGPPGTGKSLLARTIARWVGGTYFDYTLNKTSTPDELFGNWSVRQLKDNDKFVRNVEGTLVQADVAFLDEVFKGNSAILNSMLTILNERTFNAGPGVTVKCPLRMLVSASNEWAGAGDEASFRELSALWDRYLFRMWVPYVRSKEGRTRLMRSSNLLPVLSTSLSLPELDRAQADAASLPVTPDAWKAFDKILDGLQEKGVQWADRRLVQCSHGVVQAAAYLNGHAAVEREDLEVLAHTLWDDPADEVRAKVAEVVVAIANPTAQEMNAILGAVHEALAKISWDAPDGAEAMVSTRKLDVALRGLQKLPQTPQVKTALRHVQQQRGRLYKAMIEADGNLSGE